MRRWLVLSVLCAACGQAGAPSGTSSPTPTATEPGGDWTLAWSDEFDGAPGARPDASKWNADQGGGGWGNNELETYTDRPENAALSGDGALVITARQESFRGTDGIPRDYTSARLNTASRFETTYGKIEARIRIPRGQGLWPAFWILGANIGAVGWPGCGEVDIMENIGRQPEINWGSMHGPGYSGANAKNAAYNAGGALADDFHVYGLEWEKDRLQWSVDGNVYETRTPADVAGRTWVFDHPFFVIVNVAVGGDWPGAPDSTTVFPQEMRIDYVRVSRRAS